MKPALLDVHPEVAGALVGRLPVVALESTLIAHGLPWPSNLETARAAEAVVRQQGAVPATIAVIRGRPTIGLDDQVLEELAHGRVEKASRRDLAAVVARQATAATTVAATMFLAHQAGIHVLATGGIGGVHPCIRGEEKMDVSADLVELARTPVAVVCAGAKSVLDIAQTLEFLETLAVPVVGYRSDEFPAFFLRSSGQRVPARVDTPAECARLLTAHWALQGAGVVVAQPVWESAALDAKELQQALDWASGRAAEAGIRGKDVTPFLLARLAEATGGKTVQANQVLVSANARLAAEVAAAIAHGTGE